MKKFKPSFGYVAVLLAVIFTMSSAFKPETKFSQYRFFRNAGAANSVSKADYIYRPLGGCDEDVNSNCSAIWEQSSAPSLNDHPLPSATLVTNSVDKGDYNGN